MATPTLDKFLSEISRLIRDRNAAELQNYLALEPPYGQLYEVMISEIRRSYPKGNEEALEKKCEALIPAVAGGGEVASWTAFTKFMVQYMCFLRDASQQNLLETYNLLSELVQKCNSALGHGTLSILVLPTVVKCSRLLARIAIGLDKQPELIAHVTQQKTGADEGAKETLPERAANIIRQAFTTCLNDRSGAPNGVTKEGEPDGKKAGIYKIANLCLKVLFQCRKTRNAEQMFANIDNQSPPLEIYPRAERVTYLYYLGRFLFSTNHFVRAQEVLQTAYDNSPRQRLKQRRLILIYLTAANIIIGRFPSIALLARPEATGLATHFLPICVAIRKGDLGAFRSIFDLAQNPSAAWFLRFRIHLQLRNRCEVLVWRSIFRRSFLKHGVTPTDGRTAAQLAFEDVLRVANASERAAPVATHADPDFDGLVAGGNASGVEETDMMEIESIATSLLAQGLLNGFVAHRLRKFAIKGAKERGALVAGFPNVWNAIKSRPQEAGERVPGWAKVKKAGPGAAAGRGAFGPGMVVNLAGARAVGSAQ